MRNSQLSNIFKNMSSKVTAFLKKYSPYAPVVAQCAHVTLEKVQRSYLNNCTTDRNKISQFVVFCPIW